MTIDASRTTLAREAAIAALLFLVCGAVFSSSFSYGFVSDDFGLIELRTWDQVWSNWKSVGFRRPLDEAFFFAFHRLFGYNPVPYRVFIFLVYGVNTYLVYRLARALTGRAGLGVLVAVFFAANTVQFRNVYWISCNLLVFATTFFLAALLVFLRYLREGGQLWLALSFGLALVGLLATKEDLVAFPVVALVLSAHQTIRTKRVLTWKDIVPIIRPTVVFWSIPVLFVGVRGALVAIVGGRGDCPYNLVACFESHSDNPFRVDVLGIHVLENLARHIFWNLGNLGAYWLDLAFSEYAGVFEWRKLGAAEYAIIVGFVAGLGTLYWVYRKRISSWYFVLGWAWFVATLLPTLAMPDHVYPYFSALSAVGLFLALTMWLHAATERWSVKAARLGGTLLLGLFLVNSLYWTRANESVNVITTTSRLLQRLEVDLKRMYPAFPPGTTLVFPGIHSWFLGEGAALRVMYQDRPLTVLGQEMFAQGPGGFYATRKVDLRVTATHVFVNTEEGLQEITLEFFAVYRGERVGT